MLYISSASNPTIKEIKGLHRRKDRWAKKSFIIEGIKIIEECIENKYPLSYIVFSKSIYHNRRGKTLLEKARAHSQIIEVSDRLYKEISNTETPQGILAVAKFKQKPIEDMDILENPNLLLLDRIQDPGNMGTIIRSADAFGIDGIIITEGCVDIYNPKVVRATMGSLFRVPVYYCADGVETVRMLKDMGIRIYSTSVEEGELIQYVNFNIPMVFIVGNESRGVSKSLELLSDALIKIPMIGETESLNAAVATSIIMYEIIKQRLIKD